MARKFRNMGQNCAAAKRSLVQRGVDEAFAARLVERVRVLQVGPGLQAGVTQGPLINSKAIDKVLLHVADALDKGPRAAIGGAPDARGGLFFQPTVPLDVTPPMRNSPEQTIGPGAPLLALHPQAEHLATPPPSTPRSDRHFS